MEENQNQQKISLPETIIMVLICGGADFFDIVANLLSTTIALMPVFLALELILAIIVLLVIVTWLIIRRIGGLWGTLLIVANLLKFIPVINILPMRTFCLFIVIFVMNHPRIVKTALKATEVATSLIPIPQAKIVQTAARVAQMTMPNNSKK
ncbi:MAG: hypothetical protein WC297_02325 [Candidatus Paceibacterota bacterium]|jgi:hypothetical protein